MNLILEGKSYFPCTMGYSIQRDIDDEIKTSLTLRYKKIKLHGYKFDCKNIFVNLNFYY